MTRDEFQTRLMDVRGHGSNEYELVFQQIREHLRNLDETQQFDILFPLAIRDQLNAPSLPAAELLFELNPSCPLACEEAVRSLLDEWEISIEEVPFYLAACFGVPRVRKALEVVGSVLEGDRKVRLETIAYWLKKYEEAYKNIS